MSTVPSFRSQKVVTRIPWEPVRGLFREGVLEKRELEMEVAFY